MTSAEEYSEAYNRNFIPMVHFVTKRGVPRETAEEIVQSAWVHGWDCLHQLRDTRLLVVWLRRIAASKLGDYFRSLQRVRQLEAQETIAVPPAVTFAAVDAAIDAERVLELCEDEQQRVMCSRVYIDECPYSQVALEMGVSKDAFNCALFRLRRRLRQKLDARDVIYKMTSEGREQQPNFAGCLSAGEKDHEQRTKTRKARSYSRTRGFRTRRASAAPC